MSDMKFYSIRRRNGWKTTDELDRAAAESSRVGNQEMPDKVRWIRSYVVDEGDGTIGTVCFYEATGPDAHTRTCRARGPARQRDRGDRRDGGRPS